MQNNKKKQRKMSEMNTQKFILINYLMSLFPHSNCIINYFIKFPKWKDMKRKSINVFRFSNEHNRTFYFIKLIFQIILLIGKRRSDDCLWSWNWNWLFRKILFLFFTSIIKFTTYFVCTKRKQTILYLFNFIAYP